MNTDTFYGPKEWISIAHNLRVARESMPYLDISGVVKTKYLPHGKSRPFQMTILSTNI